ncbi:alpha/beta-hydrolase, partial [Ramicandelaber brevisporus]
MFTGGVLLFGAAVLMIAGGVVMLYRSQNDLIYQANFPEGSRVKVFRPDAYAMRFEDVELTTSDGVKVTGYLILRPTDDEAKKAPTLVYFHANAGNMGHRMPVARILYESYNVNIFMLSYRGYGLSEGSPSEDGIRLDADAALRFLQSHAVVGKQPLVAYGQSIGGAVAIDCAQRHPGAFAGLMLENTFRSLPLLMQHLMPMLAPVSFLCHQKWESQTKLKIAAALPMLFLSGGQDTLVPVQHMQYLYN